MAQTFFPITPVEVTPETLAAWQDVDVTAYVDAGNTTGVILHIINNGTSSKRVDVRKNGSTDDHLEYLGPTEHCWCMIGIDSNDVFEAYVGSTTDIDIFLVGYTKSGVTFFTNGIDYTPANGDTWEEKDATSDTSANTIGLIFETYTEGEFYVGARKNGSTDDRTNAQSLRNTIGVIIGCDNSQIVELYSEAPTFGGSPVPEFYLTGYIEDGATFNTNADDVSLGSTGSWLDLTALPSGANMGFVEVISSDIYSYGLRKNGSSEDIYYDAFYHPWAIVECDASLIIEGKIENTAVDFFVVGYSTVPAAGWSGKVSGVTDPAKVMGVDKANIAKVKGVASA